VGGLPETFALISESINAVPIPLECFLEQLASSQLSDIWAGGVNMHTQEEEMTLVTKEIRRAMPQHYSIRYIKTNFLGHPPGGRFAEN